MLKSLIDGVGAAVGGLAASVLPSFMQQYLAALSACQDEVGRFANDSAARMSPDVLADMQARAAWCGNAARTIDGAAGFNRVAAFAHNFDWGLARSTLRVFEPGLQMTLDGVYFFAIGIVLGLIVVNILMLPFRIVARRRRARAW